jgi:hypothetical protein
MFLISSAALEDLQSGSKEPECKQSLSASKNPIASKSCAADGRASQSMTTFENSQQSDLPEMESASTRSLAVSPAKTSVMLVMALELKENDPGSGLSSRASLANYDHDSSSWKTSQRCLIEGWEPFSETFPESGMTRSGRLYPRAPWALHTCDDECSLWPTPTASMDGRGFGIPLHENTGRYKLSTVRRVHALVIEHGWRIHPHFTEALMGFPMDGSAIAQSETQLCPTLPKQSAEQSCELRIVETRFI